LLFVQESSSTLPYLIKLCVLLSILSEVLVTAAFLNNFGGDNVRFLARSFANPGDYYGQQSNGYRWPFGAVAIIGKLVLISLRVLLISVDSID
jgi:hypothetical protein